jgi:hypothetical protein
VVKFVNRSLHLLLAYIAQIHAFGKILPQETVAVLIEVVPIIETGV